MSLTLLRLKSAPLKMIVGKDGIVQTFYVHEEQANIFPDMTATSFKGGFKEAEEQVVRFPEDDPKVFKIFASFLYSGHVCSQKPGDEGPSAGGEFERL